MMYFFQYDEITKCANCPIIQSNEDGEYCSLISKKIENSQIVPDKCKLLKIEKGE